MKKIMIKICLFVMMFGASQGLAAELQPVTIQLNWFPNVEYAGILYAKEQGWYEDAGIDLMIKSYVPGQSPMNPVLSGEALIGVAEGDSLIKSRAKGDPVKAFAAQFQKSPLCYISKKDSGIVSPDQMAGKKVGVTHPASQTMLQILLKNQNLTIEDVTPVNIGYDLNLLINDEIDLYPGYMNDEALEIRARGYEVNLLPAFKYGYDFYGATLIAAETTLQERSEMIQKFLEVTLRGWREAYNNKEKAVQLVIEKYYSQGTLSQQMESLKMFQMLAVLGDGKKYLGWMEESLWMKGIATLAEFGQIDAPLPAADVFTMEFLEKIYFGK